MKVTDILNQHKTALSFEFFPPKTSEGFENLFETINKLQYLSPAYVSVTYGAGGSTRNKTHELVQKIQKKSNIPVIPHLTSIGHTHQDITAILEDYLENGISNILALRGDKPQNESPSSATSSDFTYAADLVAFTRKNYPQINIGVAGFPEGHPETPNRLREIDNLKAKVDSGADYICTQLFFNNNDFYDFCERCEVAGIKIPIIAGIMPITSKANMLRISELSLGTRIPAKLLKSVYRAPDDHYVENVGIHWAAEQVNDLIEKGVKGVHFYTLNRWEQIQRICDSIGITNSAQLH